MKVEDINSNYIIYKEAFTFSGTMSTGTVSDYLTETEALNDGGAYVQVAGGTETHTAVSVDAVVSLNANVSVTALGLRRAPRRAFQATIRRPPCGP